MEGRRTRRGLAAERVPPELAAATVLAAILRLYRLDHESLWIDEMFMVTMATARTPRELVFEVPLHEPHPPLYNVFMWAWVGIGEATAIWMRLSSVVFAVATVPVLYWLAIRLFDRWTAGMAVVLFAVSPFQIWYAQEARMYALLVLATVLAWYLLVRLRSENGWGLFAAYVVVAAVLGYTHVYGLFVLLAQAVVALGWCLHDPDRISSTRVRFIGMYAAIGAVLTPWLAVLMARLLFPDPTFEDPTAWLDPPGVVHFTEAIRILVFGATRQHGLSHALPDAPVPLWILMAVPPALLAAAWLLDDLDEDVEGYYLLVVWITIPVAVPFVLSWLVQPMFELRYIIVVAPAVLLVFAGGIRTLRTPPLRLLLLGLVVFTLAIPLPVYYVEYQKDEWREATAFVDGEAGENDLIIVYPGWTADAFEYYYGDGPGEVLQLWEGQPPSEHAGAIDGAEDVYLVISHTEQECIVEQTSEVVGQSPEKREEVVNIEIHVYKR